MFKLVISSLYFFLPAYLANMMPVFAVRVRLPWRKGGGAGGWVWRELPLGGPVSEKWLGAHKTWRGVYAGFFGALLMLVAQMLLQKYGIFEEYRILNYFGGVSTSEVSGAAGGGVIAWVSLVDPMGILRIIGFALLFGVGALFGDAVKSFFKRRVGVKPGGVWFPFDQIDFVLGAFLFLWPFVDFGWEVFVAVLVVTPLLHFLANVIGYLVGLKKVWW